MALAQKASPPQQISRRIWKKPKARTNWLWLIVSLLLYAGISFWYFTALKVQPDAGPDQDPFRIFGIIAFTLVILVVSYTLRRRFVRILPGRVEGWLWLHTWLGIVSILVALQHEVYENLSDLQLSLSTFIASDFGVSALYGLILLVISGVIGRLLDIWQARIISVEANRNGFGIAQSVKERIHELDLLIERLSAGKPTAFKQLCAQALHARHTLPSEAAPLAPQEITDFQHLRDVISSRTQLMRSLQRQRRAHFTIRGWRYVHITVACFSLFFICTHSLLELSKMLLDIILH
jgi:hypothetical protein